MLTVNGLKARAALLRQVRAFFEERGFVEIETPVRVPCLAPEAHIVPETSSGWYLRTSPEICMKRLIARGAENIFQICRCFRHGERGSRHLQEFTMLEWYRARADYQCLMDDCRDLFLSLSGHSDNPGKLCFQGRDIDFSGQWKRITVAEAFAGLSPVSLDQALSENTFDEILVEYIEPRLPGDRPVFLCDYPARLGSLARLKDGNPEVAERFELYIGGLEIANGFSELTDAVEQRRRFENERDVIEKMGRLAGPMPEKFLRELPAIHSAAGIALGIDRLAMLFLNAARIDDVVAFTPEEL